MLSDTAILPRSPCGEQSAKRLALPAHGNPIHRIANFTQQKDAAIKKGPANFAGPFSGPEARA
jgi:hypothetical protein